MELIKNKEIIDTEDLDKYWNRIKVIMHDLSKSEGWLELIKDISSNRNGILQELISKAHKAEDIRYINNLGIKISMYDYILNMPNTYIEFADRYFKSKEKKENKK